MNLRMALDVPPWLGEFQVSHARAARKELAPSATALYREQRESFSKWFTEMQTLSGPGEARARKAFRVTHGLPIVLRSGEVSCEAITADISSNGFASLLYADLAQDQECDVRMDLLDGSSPIELGVAVVAVIRRGGSVRTAFRITRISPEDQERLETVLISLALRHLLE